MKTRLSYKKIVALWLLALSVLVTGTASSASWQCLNGAACSSACPMLLRSSAPTIAGGSPCSMSAVGHCAKCQTNIPAIHAVTTPLSVNCSAPCVLKADTRPAAALTQKQVVYAPLLALPPPPHVQVVPVQVVAVSTPPPICFYPQRFLRPHSGRAPPVLL